MNKKKIITAIILLLSSMCFGIAGDFDGNGSVFLEDLILMAADWLNETPDIVTPAVDMNSDDVVNLEDFALFAAEWLKGNPAPVASDAETAVTTYLVSRITLTATDSEPLRYIVTSLPAKGYLRDIDCAIISSVPRTLKSNAVCYETTVATSGSFDWKANDGTSDSDTATQTLTVTAHPQDHLSFGKDGIVTIADHPEFDLTGNRGIALFIRTYADNCLIMSKVESGVGGWTFSLVSGKPTVKLYGASGLTNTVTYPAYINDGQWYNLGFAYDPTNDKVWIGTQENSTDWESVTDYDYSNAASLTIGNGFWWDIDNIRSYTFTEYDNNLYSWSGFVDISPDGIIQTRADAGDGNVPLGITVHPAASVRFHCNYDGVNNTATQIYDDLTNHYTGAINSRRYVRYYPYFMEPCK